MVIRITGINKNKDLRMKIKCGGIPFDTSDSNAYKYLFLKFVNALYVDSSNIKRQSYA